MSAAILLSPGQATLADWRAIYRGAPVSIEPIARADAEAGAAALQAILARDATAPAQDEPRPPAERSEPGETGEPLPPGIVRLLIALKLASLAQGMSGVRWEVIERLASLLSGRPLPPISEENGGPRTALSRIAEIVAGNGHPGPGRVDDSEERATGAPARSGLGLSPPERAALQSGTQLSAAFALAGLFEAERVFQSALVSAALSTRALGGADVLLHPRVHILHRHPGEIEVAAALRALLAGQSAELGSATGFPRAEDFGAGRALAQMGACLDLLRQAGDTLERAANAVSEDRLVLWQSEQVVAGFPDASSIALSADLIALALREVGSLAQPRVARLSARSNPQNGEPAPQSWQSMVASFIGENTQRGCPTGIDVEPRGLAQVSAAGPRRLLPMAGTTALLVAIEFLAAAKALGAGRPGETGGRGALGSVLDLLHESVPPVGEDTGIFATDLPAAAALVRSGALAATAGVALPSVVNPLPVTARQSLGAQAKRT